MKQLTYIVYFWNIRVFANTLSSLWELTWEKNCYVLQGNSCSKLVCIERNYNCSFHVPLQVWCHRELVYHNVSGMKCMIIFQFFLFNSWEFYDLSKYLCRGSWPVVTHKFHFFSGAFDFNYFWSVKKPFDRASNSLQKTYLKSWKKFEGVRYFECVFTQHAFFPQNSCCEVTHDWCLDHTHT